jgi:hypothetical protein
MLHFRALYYLCVIYTSPTNEERATNGCVFMKIKRSLRMVHQEPKHVGAISEINVLMY